MVLVAAGNETILITLLSYYRFALYTLCLLRDESLEIVWKKFKVTLAEVRILIEFKLRKGEIYGVGVDREGW